MTTQPIDDARALYTALAEIIPQIDDAATRSALIAIADVLLRQLQADVLNTINDEMRDGLRTIRADMYKIRGESVDQREAISQRIHTLANHIMALENRVMEIAELITTYFEADA